MELSAGKFGETVENPLLSQASRLRLTRKFSIGNFRWFFNGDMNENTKNRPARYLDIIQFTRNTGESSCRISRQPNWDRSSTRWKAVEARPIPIPWTMWQEYSQNFSVWI